MISSLTSAYTNMSQAQLQNQVSTSVLRKAMDVQETQGAAVVKLLSTAGQAQNAAPFQDPMVGQRVDTYA